MVEDNKRENFRIHYFGSDHPKFYVAGKKYPVVDISMTGLLFQFPRDLELPELDEYYSGTVKFQDGTVVKAEGTVVRTQAVKHRVALIFVNPLAGALLMDQHRKWIVRVKQVKSS